MRLEDRTRILHMIETGEAIADFVTARVRADLDTDRMLLFALVRAVEIFGEAASKVSAPIRTASPHIPWPQIIATRNRLVHAYFEVDPDILWIAAIDEIPNLLPRLKRLIETDL